MLVTIAIYGTYDEKDFCDFRSQHVVSQIYGTYEENAFCDR
ncbi:hypothetical protein [uncultured Prevotella sp.]|nr:hypothetical protein [uncultured Prevotella sp.]